MEPGRRAKEARRRETFLRTVGYSRSIERVGTHIIGLAGHQLREQVGEHARAPAHRHIRAVGHGRMWARAPGHAAFRHQRRALGNYPPAAVGTARSDGGNVGRCHLRQIRIMSPAQRTVRLESAHALARGVRSRHPVIEIATCRGRQVVIGDGTRRHRGQEGSAGRVVDRILPNAIACFAQNIRPGQRNPVAMEIVAGR